MSDKPEPKNAKTYIKQPRRIIHLGMMGDRTEGQNLGELVDAERRKKEDVVDALLTDKPRRRSRDLQIP